MYFRADLALTRSNRYICMDIGDLGIVAVWGSQRWGRRTPACASTVPPDAGQDPEPYRMTDVIFRR